MASNPRGQQVIQLSIAVGVIDTIAIALRVLARCNDGARLAFDDWLIVASLVPFYAMIVTSSLLVTKGGLGKPIVSLTDKEVRTLLKVLMSTMVTYSLTITSVKISLLFLYRRCFPTQVFKRMSMVVGALYIIWFIAAVLFDIFQCRPFTAAFDPGLAFSNQCIDLQSFYWGITVANLLLDVIILALPLRVVWALKLSKQARVRLSCIFLLGSIICIAGVMRVVSIGKLKHQDISASMTAEHAWSQIEPATAILYACAITYGPLFKSFRRRAAKPSTVTNTASCTRTHTRKGVYSMADRNWRHPAYSDFFDVESLYSVPQPPPPLRRSHSNEGNSANSTRGRFARVIRVGGKSTIIIT